MPGQAALEGVDVLFHGARIAYDAACPLQYPLALRREAAESRAALYQQDPERLFQLLDAGRECGLAHARSLGRPAEMLLTRERNDVFEFVDHDRNGCIP